MIILAAFITRVFENEDMIQYLLEYWLASLNDNTLDIP